MCPASCCLDQAPGTGVTPYQVSYAMRRFWAELPLDLGVFVCEKLEPRDIAKLMLVDSRVSNMCYRDDVWHFLCRSRWGNSANFGSYDLAKDLYFHENGWFPQRAGQRASPQFDLSQIQLHNEPCLTMDLRITENEIITVSEAPKDGSARLASVQVVNTAMRELCDRFTVSDATINCCDVGRNLICLGSDDAKVRVYSRGDPSDGTSSNAYRLASEFACASQVNDLRLTREGALVAVRTHNGRHPAALDVIHLNRPDAKLSLPAGSQALRGKYIHGIDGFLEGCSLSCIPCSGEDPITRSFSAMLFDFRLKAPCVMDKPMISEEQGHPKGTMLWPLRAGRDWAVYANIINEATKKSGKGSIGMMDLRYPSIDVCNYFQLPAPIDDFRCFGSGILAACSEPTLPAEPSTLQKLNVYRCTPSSSDANYDCLGTIAEYDLGERHAGEDLKTFAVCPWGFAASYAQHVAVGTIRQPKW